MKPTIKDIKINYATY